jgi:hypothetical protein
VRIELGPLPSDGALIWLAYARTVLAEIISARNGDVPSLDPVVIEALEAVLDDWDDAASHSREFRWQVDLPENAVLKLVEAWLDISEYLRVEAEQRGFDRAPRDGEGFYNAAIAAVVDAFDQRGRDPEFAGKLVRMWSGAAAP